MTPTTEIIIGSPGTGKTTSLLEIVDEELKRGTDPGRIGFVSFTKQAAEQAVTRACEKFNMTRRQFNYFRTLHSLAFHQLGMRRADVLEGSRLREFSKFAGIRISGRHADDGNIYGLSPGDRAIYLDNLARVKLRGLREEYEDDDAGLSWRELDRISRSLAQFKQERGLQDFTDMLSGFVASGMRPNIDVLLVDEAQDLSKLQWKMVHQLAAGCRRVVIAGDDDQALFSPWAGADVQTFIDLPGASRVLGQSYRVPRRVQDLAGGIIDRVVQRRPKTWAARAAEGVIDRAVDFGDVDIDGPQVLILARNTYIIKEQIEPELRHRGVFYERNGKLSVDPKLLVSIGDWESLRSGRSVLPEGARSALTRISKWGPVGTAAALDDLPAVEMSDLERLCGLRPPHPVWYEAFDLVPPAEVEYVRAARARGEKLSQRPRVRVSTIHSTKGAEAEHVVLFTEMAPRTAEEALKRPDDEARVWYVGTTRAKERLTLVASSSPNRYRL